MAASRLHVGSATLLLVAESRDEGSCGVERARSAAQMEGWRRGAGTDKELREAAFFLVAIKAYGRGARELLR